MLQERPVIGISLGEEAIGFARMPGAALAFTAGSPSSTAKHDGALVYVRLYMPQQRCVQVREHDASTL